MTEFIVSVTNPGQDQPEVTSAELHNSLVFSGFGWTNVHVRKYDPESEVGTSKIEAIKRVRTLLNCSLRDAKFLADRAESTGSAHLFHVEVHYNSLGFRVIETG